MVSGMQSVSWTKVNFLSGSNHRLPNVLKLGDWRFWFLDLFNIITTRHILFRSTFFGMTSWLQNCKNIRQALPMYFMFFFHSWIETLLLFMQGLMTNKKKSVQLPPCFCYSCAYIYTMFSSRICLVLGVIK